MDSEDLSKKLKLSQEAVRKMERELGQVNVEKEWLISQQKSAVGSRCVLPLSLLPQHIELTDSPPQ